MKPFDLDEFTPAATIWLPVVTALNGTVTPAPSWQVAVLNVIFPLNTVLPEARGATVPVNAHVPLEPVNAPVDVTVRVVVTLPPVAWPVHVPTASESVAGVS